MAEETSNIVVRAARRLGTLLGQRSVDVINNTRSTETPHVVTQYKGTFSTYEMNTLSGTPDGKSNKLNVQQLRDIQQTLQDTSKAIGSHVSVMKRFKMMNPEIAKAKRIYVSSIMSPSDLQTGQVNFSVDYPGISDDVSSELAKLLSSYFNNDLSFGIKLTKWIGDAMFDYGAAAVLTLPKSVIRVVSDISAHEAALLKQGRSLTLGTESYLACDDITKIKHTEVACEALDEYLVNTVFDDSTASDAYQVLVDNRELDELIGDKYASTEAFQEDFRKAVVGAQSGVDKLAKQITFSTDYRSIVSASDTKKQVSAAMDDRIRGSMFGSSNDRLFTADTEGEVADGDHPTMIELPIESVIPVSVPGAPSEHIGYFILVDDNGNPINNSTSAHNKACSESTTLGGAKLLSDLKIDNSDQKFKASSAVFGVVMRRMMESKLVKDATITLENHQAISNTLFRRVLSNAKIRIVYVPANLMSYYAFDYREDGTGKSMLEDSEYILSIRTTLLIANVMAAIRNATDYRKVSFEVEDTSNVEQLMSTIREIYLQKYVPEFGTDPVAASRMIMGAGLSVVPKQMDGISGLSVESENVSRDRSSVDTDTIEQIQNMLFNDLGVPHSALNELGETEFARSVTSNNLLFANDVRTKQAVVTKICTRQCRQYTQSSYSLISQIVDIIKESAVDTDDMHALLIDVINSIRCTLPTPTAAAQRSQFDDLESYFSLIDRICETLYNEEFAMVDTPKAQEAIIALRAQVKQLLTTEAIRRVGFQGIIDIPSIEDIDKEKLFEFNQAIINVAKGMRNLEHTLGKELEEDPDSDM